MILMGMSNFLKDDDHDTMRSWTQPEKAIITNNFNLEDTTLVKCSLKLCI
jgi:hypothetical protein